MRVVLFALVTVLATALAAACGAADAAALQLSSRAIGADGRIAERYSAYGRNLSPPLVWSGAAGAASYAVVLDDPDAPGGRPFVHWLIWNIPGGVSSLPEGLPQAATLTAPAGALQGTNDVGGVGYFGPKPPSGVHHYSFKVFALDRRLALAPGANREALAQALNGHVLAIGVLKGTYAAPAAR